MFSLMKYSNLTNICKTKYKERHNTKKFNLVSSNNGIIPKEMDTNIAIEFKRNANLLYFLEQSPDFCS